MDKDWTGNSKTTYTSLGASNHSEKDREVNDYYATDPQSIDDLFSLETFEQNIWEPACGGGHMSERMGSLGKTVRSTDLVDRGYGENGIDFLQETGIYYGDIITNPPYKFAQEFIEKSMELIPTGNKVAMFLKLTFLEGQKRKKMFAKYPPKTIYVYSKRINCAMNGDFETYKVNSAICYCWYVWEKGYTGDPVIKWI